MGFWDQLRQKGFESRRLDEKLGEAVAIYAEPAAAEAEAPAEELALEPLDGEEIDPEFVLEIAEDEALIDDEVLLDDEALIDDEALFDDEALVEEVPEVVEATDPGTAGGAPAAGARFRSGAPEADSEDEHAGEDTVTDSVLALDDPEDDTQQFSVGPRRYLNSLGLSDRRVIAILREENYPHLEDVDDDTLVALSRLEEELMERAVGLGEAYLRLQDLIATRDLWQAAIWVTGMHRDPMMREGLRRLRQEGSADAARWLGWMVWPYTEELLGAAEGFDDPAGIREACRRLADALQRRAALIRSGPQSMSLEAARYPAEAQGIFRREGFRWLAD